MPELIPIDDTRVLSEQRGEEYIEIRENMEKKLARPEKVHRYATHESGHLIYLMRTGLISSPEDAVFAGPTIYSEENQIRYFMAAVTSRRARLSDKTLVYTEDLLDKLSLVAVAGTVFEVEFHGEDEETSKASQGDENNLHAYCYKAMAEVGIPFEGYTLWPSAKKRVTECLNKNRAELESSVEMARPIIFAKCFRLSTVPRD